MKKVDINEQNLTEKNCKCRKSVFRKFTEHLGEANKFFGLEHSGLGCIAILYCLQLE